MIDRVELWIVIVGMGLGSFGLRFMFTGFIGDRNLPPWVLRHLRYTAVAVLPGLVAPLVMWPAATNGQTDLPRLIAAIVTLGLGYFTKNVIVAICGGAATLAFGLLFLG
ncbi:AzlD domain-containing protein [Shimia thalassica]|jgi:branched-subunit amino acid transport protein|uniref:Putative membrane protein n=1 Tax=Shimia thalassica TaxID=1715693 RepID=A0A0P1ICM7_9RHOB|nr:AzlD domain-containing protein [Shimia thalassica]PHO04416.1 AzlD domain-containing protein [Rhodobacteraceae bacterium 4F10]MBU2943631.1 AzlD domain-containing protein [Shimia thalassica]MDO6478555.1 AzlD domain-containing protein [Shimia thalassica]MDO6484710.1 AzlD domain-containing protein [Shimia thalassica]MDO6501702.1 AzlD domain-containing protein [Shimia thalassica]